MRWEQASLGIPFRLTITLILIGASLGILIQAYHHISLQSCHQLIRSQLSKLEAAAQISTQFQSQHQIEINLPECLDELVLGGLPQSQGSQAIQRSEESMKNYYYRISGELTIMESALGWGDRNCNPLSLTPGNHRFRISSGECYGLPAAILEEI